MTRHGDPGSLLSLVDSVGPLPEDAWTVSIPASNLDLGFELSAATARGVESAVDAIVALVRR